MKKSPHRTRRIFSLLLLAMCVVVAVMQQAQSRASSAAAPPASPSATTDAPVVAEPATSVKDVILNAQPGLAHVSHDIDGDTIEVVLGDKTQTVRFIGIDTPETHDPRKPVQCYGEIAAAHTKALLEGKDVRLEADPTDSDRDKYGRLLRYVYLPNGTLVNAQLIANGYAFAYTVFPYTKLDDFVTLENQAKTANRGLWGACNVNASQQIKQTAGTK